MPQVGCAGILVADTFCGPFESLPQPGELLALESMPAKAGGCAANVAIDLAKQGISADVLGCVGHDPAAEIVLTALKSQGIGTTRIQRVTEPTSQTVVLLERDQDRRYLHVFGANKSLSTEAISKAWLESLNVFYLGGLFVLPGIELRELAKVLLFCQAKMIITVLDVVIPRSQQDFLGLKELLPYVDYFLPNQDEAKQLTQKDLPEEQAQVFLEQGVKNVIITQGDKGVFTKNQTGCWQAESFNINAIDMSGSGDAFAAGVITGIVKDWDMMTTIAYASALGASATRAIGTTDGVFTAVEAETFLRNQRQTVRRVL